MPDGIWSGFDAADVEAHLDEIAAEKAEADAEAQAELDAENAQH